jgi:hypothetical protein
METFRCKEVPLPRRRLEKGEQGVFAFGAMLAVQYSRVACSSLSGGKSKQFIAFFFSHS